MKRAPELTINPANYEVGSYPFLSRLQPQLTSVLFVGFCYLFLLLLFVVVLRRERLALVALWIFVTIPKLSSAMKTSARRAGVNECVTKTPDMGAVSEAIRQMIEKN